MPSSSSLFLPDNISEILQRTLEVFRKADQKAQKGIIKDAAKDTLPAGGNMKDHKKVSHGIFLPWSTYFCFEFLDGETMVLQPWKKKKTKGQSDLCEEVEREPGCWALEKG